VLRVTVDANILVSGFVYRRGKPFQLLRKALEGEINLTVSQAIIDETIEVMSRKFGATAEDLAEARAIIEEAARVVQPAVALDVIIEDPDDNRVLECAVSAGSDCIVTGDKDLLRLGRYDSIRILSVSDFLELAQGN
jgi:putative PIN family toxin of toxin-antitoxin system